MKHILCKGSLGFYVEYPNDYYSNDLMGRNFTYCDDDGQPCLQIDMSGNLHTEFKDSDTYQGASQLVEHPAELMRVQFNKDLYNEFRRFERLAFGKRDTGKNSECVLELDFAERGCFRYSMTDMNRNHDHSLIKIDVKFIPGAGAAKAGVKLSRPDANVQKAVQILRASGSEYLRIYDDDLSKVSIIIDSNESIAVVPWDREGPLFSKALRRS